MGYIGNRPTAVPLTSADIQDSIITSAKILDGTIVNADVNASAAIAESKLTVSSFDDTDLRSDIMTLALKEAITENRVAYNLPNSMVEQFQDDSKLGTETDCDRQSAEYMDTATTSSVVDSTCVFLIHSDTTDASTTFTDSSDNGYTVTANGGAQHATAQSKIGGSSMYFDGTGDYLEVVTGTNDIIGTGDFTIEAWLRPASTSWAAGTDTVWGRGTGDSVAGAHLAAYFSSAAALYISDDGTASHMGTTGAPQTYTHSAWQHMAFVRESGTINHYIDGVLGSATASDATDITATGNFQIGTGYGWYEGYMDDFRFCTSAKYSGSSFTPPTTALTGTTDTITVNATGTLISTAQTANSAQTKVSGVILYKNEEGTATLGTDLKIYFTCNGGTNWTESTPTAAGTFSSGILMAKCPEVTCTSGTDIRYKAVWANQSSGSKETQLHGIGVNY